MVSTLYCVSLRLSFEPQNICVFLIHRFTGLFLARCSLSDDAIDQQQRELMSAGIRRSDGCSNKRWIKAR